MTLLNEEMINISKNNYYQISENEPKIKEQNVIMINNHNVLLDERHEIEKMVRQFETLEAAYEDGNIIVTANYSNYVVLLFVVVFLILLLLRFAISSPQYYYGGGHKQTNAYTIVPLVFGVIFFIIVVNAFLKND